MFYFVLRSKIDGSVCQWITCGKILAAEPRIAERMCRGELLSGKNLIIDPLVDRFPVAMVKRSALPSYERPGGMPDSQGTAVWQRPHP